MFFTIVGIHSNNSEVRILSTTLYSKLVVQVYNFNYICT